MSIYWSRSVEEIELEMSRTQKNKATSGHLVSYISRRFPPGVLLLGGGGEGEVSISSSSDRSDAYRCMIALFSCFFGILDAVGSLEGKVSQAST